MKSDHLIKTVTQIHANDIAALFDDKLLALRIPSFFSADSASLASSWLLKNGRQRTWSLGTKNEIRTDMNYLLGVPREATEKSEIERSSYHQQVKTIETDLRTAFQSNLSPLDVFRQQLSEAINHPLTVDPFEDGPGLPAIVRYMSPHTLLESDVAEEGVCHVDSIPENKSLSVNMYIEVPSLGGELKIWDLPLEERTFQRSVYKMVIRHAFESGYRDKIQAFLPEPHVLKVAPGDLVIFDSSRPHSVRGFSKGHRMTIQTFIKRSNNRTYLFS